MRNVKIGKIKVFYKKEHDGGGIKFYKEFCNILKKKKKINNTLEFCSGPGFIAFGLLNYNITKKITLVDINKKIIKGLRKTIKFNNLNDKCNFYFGDGLQALKNKKIKFDLIVSNPPHIDMKNVKFKLPNDKKIIYDDTDFKIHKNFFKNVHNFLNPTGLILFIENSLQSTFGDIVKKNKYPKLIFLRSPKTNLPNKYYIYAKRR